MKDKVKTMISVSLLQLSEMCQGELVNTQETFKVTGVTINTRKYAGEDIFIPIIGENFDGHHYVKNAFEQGAKVALFQKTITMRTFLILLSWLTIPGPRATGKPTDMKLERTLSVSPVPMGRPRRRISCFI